MLSTVFAAEAQFRHDSEARAREFAVLESIRDRQAALAASTRAPAVMRRPVDWPRPIGVRLDVASSARAVA